MAVLPFDLSMRSQDACWDRARWEQLPDDGNRYEVVDGVLYMSTSPSLFHQWIIREAFRILATQIDDLGLGTTFFAPIGLFMPGCDPVQPDLVVIRAADRSILHDGHINGVPTVLVEVLSPSNPRYDLETKRKAYARAGVPEYVIFRPAARDVMVCSQPDDSLGDYGHTELIASDGQIELATLPFRAQVADFFAGAPDTTL
ncbi:MAG TPA: Uma2 family endonuclease [Chloroflexota bacterium]|jgi:Uma2 family endonuclease